MRVAERRPSFGEVSVPLEKIVAPENDVGVTSCPKKVRKSSRFAA
jgi:hypothetical protein